MNTAKKTFIGLTTLLVIVFGLIQLYPVRISNPPVEEDVPASPEAKAVLHRACYDCHSNETHWPWYSHVAPVSWLLAKDVQDGRDAMNFSTWSRYDTRRQIELMAEGWEEVEEGEMPPWFYLPAHREAVLSKRDKQLLRVWALGQRQRPEAFSEDHED